MQQLLELQTGQVAFLSGLLAGFSLTVAANVLQIESDRIIHKVSLGLLILATLLFLVALYVDVRLTIELATVADLGANGESIISKARLIGTTSATVALVVFIIAIGTLGWLASPLTGIASTFFSALTLAILAYVWLLIFNLPRL